MTYWPLDISLGGYIVYAVGALAVLWWVKR